MSKKSKRQSRKTPGKRARASRSESVVSVASASGDIISTQVSENSGRGRSSRTFEPEFNPDYSQTIKDLRRIGTLAGTFFLVLIVLSFFLR